MAIAMLSRSSTKPIAGPEVYLFYEIFGNVFALALPK
ncbi:hypothetical protein SAMN00120144_1831 [Hymenobacter roseosalivarius DSM 11622]|uniref:Uncharacterized protein n=1 Tax=Hymenobacter roseosalivarius DSM 11622 TaxID=645990 RepID=A0A1W1W1A9_9BACT|nr:hypothetical protein SAMN00120144_1831 [Hymenobacter roseosalivarius DSM 11622]